MGNGPGLKMYFLLKTMGIFQPAILVYQKGTVDGRNPKQPPGMVKTL